MQSWSWRSLPSKGRAVWSLLALLRGEPLGAGFDLLGSGKALMFFQGVASALMSRHSPGFIPPAPPGASPRSQPFEGSQNLRQSPLRGTPVTCSPQQELGGVCPPRRAAGKGGLRSGARPRSPLPAGGRWVSHKWDLSWAIGAACAARVVVAGVLPAASQRFGSFRGVSVFRTLPVD